MLKSMPKAKLPVMERHFTPDELGKMWHVSANTVRRWCEDFGDVLMIDRPEERFKRGYKTVGIPESTATKIYAAHFEAAA